MKFLKALVLASFAVSGLVATAAPYDNTWHQAEYWSGEYPNGFSVKAENVSVPARAAMDPELPITIQCGVPFRAAFSPWDAARPARYFSAAKIVPMTAKEDLLLGYPEDGQAEVKKGDVIEYLIYGSEGSFTVRYAGKEYVGDQDLLEKVTYDQALMDVPADEWVSLTCTGGEAAWILMKDLETVTPEGDVAYLPGLGSWYLGFRDYGSVTDLTDEDLAKEEP